MQTTCLYISIHILSEYTFNSQYIKIKYMTIYQQKQTANKLQNAIKSNIHQGINVKHARFIC